MGILCTCKQPIIYSKEKQIIDIDPKIQKPKKELTNKSTTLKSKIFTKDTTFINHSNDNSPDKDEIIYNFNNLIIDLNLKNESRNALHLNININSIFDVCLQKKM